MVSCRRRASGIPQPDRCTERDQRLESHLIQELQVHQIVVGAALYDEGFTGIDPLVPAWSRGGDNATESSNRDEKTAVNEKKWFECGQMREAQSLPRPARRPQSPRPSTLGNTAPPIITGPDCTSSVCGPITFQ